ncbi:MAG: hypothetical protein Q7U63_09140 [Polaromonas sp.]|uniref:hypothetical protein n=1 Tax=Polaromonas sp. TaxID=1869339 RepID=UPI00271C0C53|nr:hypothetical protein [Polaromonas sp.]MDO9113947.1 hypothetical protein [Polaromonas sp.]MDP1887372.1 hypothetical protein [Polaromonas sp.]
MHPVAQCAVKSPQACSQSELNEFFDLVALAGKVATAGLQDRLQGAHSLAFLRLDGALIGVAGLKRPTPGYRARVAASSGTVLPESTYAFELGWMSVAPVAAGGKSMALCQPLMVLADADGVFATTGTDNGRMQTTLGKLGFARTGAEWRSKEADEMLCLFVRKSADKAYA